MSQQNEEMEPIIPVEQDLVPFEQTTLLAVRLPDDRVAALFSLLCESLQLDRAGQVRRIKADPAIADCLILARIETPGGPQNLNVLIAGAIPKWLSGIRLGKVAPELRPFLLALQREAADVLYRHFFKIDAGEKAAPSPRKMTHRAFERLHQAADALHQVADELDESYMVGREKIEAMGDHIVALEAEVASLKQEPARDTRRQTTVNPVPSDSPRLSKDHLYQMYALAHDERRRSGQRVDRLLRELAEAFGVEDTSDIPDARWEEVAAWFWERRQRETPNRVM
jgi:hypothetical protein